MGLPSLIEIVPLSSPAHANLTIPGSKSITNRALVLAALGSGRTSLRGALWSEDTQVMTEALVTLGFTVEVLPDPGEPSNRTIIVNGRGGQIPNGGTADSPLELEVANAGTAARFLSALVCLGKGWYRLSGVDRMHERPQASLFSALRQLGYELRETGGHLPVIIRGTGAAPGHKATVSLAESSQFASALLLAASHGGWDIEVEGGGDADEAPYVEMTRQLIATFPKGGGDFVIEPDASSASYFWAAGWISRVSHPSKDTALPSAVVQIADWPRSGWQVDARFPDFLPLPSRVSRELHLGDSILTAMVVAAAAERSDSVEFTDLGRLRVQECERVVAMRTELTRCAASIIEVGDTLRIEPTPLHGATLETYKDHRMAMCWATLGLKVPGIKIRDPRCVRKTFPNFFQKLSALPPHGLGVSIWECDPVTGERTRRLTEPSDLFAL